MLLHLEAQNIQFFLLLLQKKSNKEVEETQDEEEENNKTNADSVVSGREVKDESMETNGKF